MSEKTEQPTPKKLRDARKKGQIAVSKDLNGIVTYLAGLVLIFVVAGHIGDSFRAFYGETIELIGSGELGRDDIWKNMTGRALDVAFGLLVPLVGTIAVIGGAAAYLQAGPLFTTEPMTPKLSKLNPLAKIKQWFAPKGLFEFAKTLLKLIFVLLVGYMVMRRALPEMLTLGAVGERELLGFASTQAKYFLAIVGFIFLVLGVVDFYFQKWQHKRGLRMSKDEIKREHKSSEGDPQIKGQRKQLHRQMVMGGAPAKATKMASAVVVNPTHIAVALRYDEEESEAPIVLAKGAEKLAREILRYAHRYQVPVIQDKPLAWALMELEVDEEIDPDLYEAVAEVLQLARKIRTETAAAAAGRGHGGDVAPPPNEGGAAAGEAASAAGA